jgi:Domain of unknown function (DUF4396)
VTHTSPFSEHIPQGGMIRPMDSTWRLAITATRHCLTGCAIGEILGMVIGTAADLPAAATVALAIALAFVFGYALTMRGVLRSGLSFGAALRVALAADTVSIAVMELVDNAFIIAVPGAMDAGLTSLLFWGSLIVSLALAFVVTVPVNHFMIGRGKGHAVVHETHGGGLHDSGTHDSGARGSGVPDRGTHDSGLPGETPSGQHDHHHSS